MKIAFFIDSLGFGGAEKSLLALLKSLDYSQMQVDLYTQLTNWEPAPEIMAQIPKEVNYLHMPKSENSWLTRMCQLNYSLKIRVHRLLGIKQHLAQTYWNAMHRSYPQLPYSYDVAISYMQGFATFYVADKVRAKKKLAWINSQLDNHGHDVKFSRKYYDKYDHVVAVSDILNQILIDKGYVDAAKLSVIYDIIDADEVKLKAQEPCALDRTHDITITTVARLSPEKNLSLAIEAAKILSDRGIDYIWHIVGEGPSHSKLQEQIEANGLTDRVILQGGDYNPYPYMQAADIYVLTSLAEGFGMTIAEAKILGRPVVSTNFPLVYVQIKDGENGLVAEMTPESVASKIMQLIEDEKLRESIKEHLKHEANLTKYTETEKFYKLISE